MVLVAFVTGACEWGRTTGKHGSVAFVATMEKESLSLSEERRFRVYAAVLNRSSTLAALSFADSQRVEAELFAPDGTQLFKWSDDHLIEPEPGVVTINPGEKLFYKVEIPTRGMVPNQPHRLVLQMQGHDRLRSELIVTPGE